MVDHTSSLLHHYWLRADDRSKGSLDHARRKSPALHRPQHAYDQPTEAQYADPQEG